MCCTCNLWEQLISLVGSWGKNSWKNINLSLIPLKNYKESRCGCLQQQHIYMYLALSLLLQDVCINMWVVHEIKLCAGHPWYP